MLSAPHRSRFWLSRSRSSLSFDSRAFSSALGSLTHHPPGLLTSLGSLPPEAGAEKAQNQEEQNHADRLRHQAKRSALRPPASTEGPAWTRPQKNKISSAAVQPGRSPRKDCVLSQEQLRATSSTLPASPSGQITLRCSLSMALSNHLDRVHSGMSRLAISCVARV